MNQGNRMQQNEITIQEAETLRMRQKLFFDTQITKDINYRVRQLKQLKAGIKRYEYRIIAALRKDLGKHPVESYATEIGYVYKSIADTMKNLHRWASPKKAVTPIYMKPAKSYVAREPYGSVLIIGPFNYPFQLLIEPLVGAISAGNCAVLKPSELTPNVSRVVTEMISEIFDPAFVSCIEGTVETNTALLNIAFDYIFFTGSPTVGRIVMKAAADHLTPVTLELGGKSPTIVDRSANIKEAANRIIWGKTVNAGQTCVAPDYVYVHESVMEPFLKALKRSLTRFYGADIKQSDSYGRIVNVRHLDRLTSILEKDKDSIIFGGNYDRKQRYLEPTILKIESREAAAMQEEIFGPILPILAYKELDTVIKDINKQPKPLALYLFTRRRAIVEKVLGSTSSGGACVNDTIMHVANPHIPFGGVGNSGIGSYHGKQSFITFSHSKSVLSKGNMNNTIAYPPYSARKMRLIKSVFR
jgi:aldehyde dehydrogenase (NAD+)